MPTATRLPVRLTADPKRVIARPYFPGGSGRVQTLVDRILALSDRQVSDILDRVRGRYGDRHRDIDAMLDRHFGGVAPDLNGRTPQSVSRRRLIAAYFTLEYSLESVALFNPSMVLHPDQDGMGSDRARFVMSLRACGEGHISSIEFRSGKIDGDNNVTLDEPAPFAACQRPVDDYRHDKNRFYLKLHEIGAYTPLADRVVVQLPDQFTIDELQRALDIVRRQCGEVSMFNELSRAMLWLVHSSYRLEFPPESDISERVIFPVTENESRGIEDARFVRFVYDDGRVVYYATFTAYNGFQSLPQFIETADFKRFKVHTLNGRCAQNKGMALFPRKIADRYVMMSRLDGENLYLLRSDDLHFWNEADKIHGPMVPWELVQIGNCGSPLETEAGWLLLTHGVGPMREYWMGAVLLDTEDPACVIGHLKEPILMPTEDERDGYVPNVVYSCGGMIHNEHLIIPYGLSDSATGIATLPLRPLLDSLAASR